MTKHSVNMIGRRLAFAAVAIGGSSAVLLAQTASTPPADEPAPIAPAAEPAQPLDGTIDGFNFGPNGSYESLMLKTSDGRVAQVNFPPHVGQRISSFAAAGSAAKLTVRPLRSMPDHPVYELASITNADGKQVTVGAPGEEKTTHVEGTVKQLNFGRDGRVNGAVLDNGTFVHVGPQEATALQLAVGQKLVVDGREKPTMSEQTVIDAETVNGTQIERPRPPAPGGPGEHHAPRPKGPKGPAGGPPRP